MSCHIQVEWVLEFPMFEKTITLLRLGEKAARLEHIATPNPNCI